ncbi:LamG-like jellyroll fold domain-containing protein [Phycisphaerales bacterium AB-hyl4]|uniref:LamG-like jellyroll fold domain-containing protein n=1 Tax=Natronomicrosphaera hydrolytica TaxID=3242702 RepID=A0ABV4U5N1_9BACT
MMALSPRAYWRSLAALDVLPDVTGQGHHCAVVSGNVTGVAGSLFRDDDGGIRLTKARLEVPSHPNLSGFDDFTMLFWMRIDAVPTSLSYVLAVLQTTEFSWFISFRNNGVLRLALSLNGTSLTNAVDINSVWLDDGQWHFCAFRRAGLDRQRLA